MVPSYRMGEASESDIRIDFLALCRETQELSAEIYHFFGDSYREIPGATLLWRKTALEEENHGKQFELVLHLKDEMEFDLTPVDLERTKVIKEKISRLLNIVKRKKPDLTRALELAIEMEEHLADLHVQTSVRFRDASVVRMFKAFERADQEHIGALKRFLAILLLPRSEMKG